MLSFVLLVAAALFLYSLYDCTKVGWRNDCRGAAFLHSAHMFYVSRASTTVPRLVVTNPSEVKTGYLDHVLKLLYSVQYCAEERLGWAA